MQGLNRQRAVAFIPARLNSSRLPRKHLIKIGDKRLLEWIFLRLNSSRYIDDIVVAATCEPVNDELEAIAASCGAHCFRYKGDPEAVTTRLKEASIAFDADICVLVSGDCPIISHYVIDAMIGRLIEAWPAADFVELALNQYGSKACLEGVEVSKKSAWELADDVSQEALKAHLFPALHIYKHLFRPVLLSLDDLYYAFPHHRYSIDTFADLEFHNALYKRLKSMGMEYALENALKLLKKTPQLMAINSHVHQRGIKEEIKRLLIIVDAGRQYGYGHLMRSMEIGLQVIERLGWPVTFATSDDTARSILRQKGIMTIDYELNEKTSLPLPKYDIYLIDIFHKKKNIPKFNSLFPEGAMIAAIDHQSSPWAKDAHLIIVPGFISGEPHAFSKLSKIPPVAGGPEYIVIRREIRYMKNEQVKKDIDLLAYLHSNEQKDALYRIKEDMPINIMVIDAYNEKNFPELLARSRFFMSGFGVSSYEALYLKSYPVIWPNSSQHERDAIRFYNNLNIIPIIIRSPDELSSLLELIRDDCIKTAFPIIKDGTPNIINALKETVSK